MGRTRRRRSLTGLLLRLLLLAAVGYLGVTAAQVWAAARPVAPGEADVIVVLGAAQYDGRPSPVLARRLDHAADLFAGGVAPRIVVTGGRQEGDRFTEAAAGAAYLEALGVPGGVIERETTGASTYSTLAAAERFLREDGVTAAVLVSDPFHNYRMEAIAREVGLPAHASATPTSLFRGTAQLGPMARETVAVALGRLIGYRRLESVGLRLEAAGVAMRAAAHRGAGGRAGMMTAMSLPTPVAGLPSAPR